MRPPVAGRWRYRLTCRRFRRNILRRLRVHQALANLGAIDHGNLELATTDLWEREFQDEGTAQYDASQALQRFGFEHTAIQVEAPSGVEIDEGALFALRG